MTIALVVHGHFYQPPRENPWTGLVEREHGAHPFHDWNERIHAECYRPNAFARISDSDPDMLRYLAALGVRPGDELEVVDKQPFGGPLSVRFGDAVHVLGGGLARAMRVEVAR